MHDTAKYIMNDNHYTIDRLILQRLVSLGVEPDVIPGLRKDLATALSLNPEINCLQLNERLRYLGWMDLELDYYTFSLVKESLPPIH